MNEPRTPCDELLLGSPRFIDPSLASIAAEHGPLAAWRAALKKGGVGAANEAMDFFSVGLHDGPGRTFLAVDRFSTHPLFYRLIDGQLHFAARAGALAAITPTAQLDAQAIFDYLYFHVIPSPRTIFTDVHRLPAAHYALLENGALTVAPYWIPAFEEPVRASFEPLAEQFRALLRGAVAAALDDSKPACFLSGGTDSSTVAGLIGQVAGRPAATYSIGFEAQGYDEMEYARLAARHFGTEHHELYMSPDELVRSIPVVAAQFDQPFGNSSALPAYYCVRMAREDGVTRLLAGDGGDELFGGNTRYAKQRVFGWYEQIPASIRDNLLQPLFGLPALQRMPLLRKGSSYIEQARVPLPDRLQMYNLLLRLGPEQMLTPSFLAQVDAQAPAMQQRQVWAQPAAGSNINRMLAYDWRYTLSEADLPKVRETAAMAGVEVGFPFLDERLLDFSLRLPSDYKLKGLRLRWFFKEALRGFLPNEIITKKKHGFGLPFGVWVNQHAKLHALAAESVYGVAARGIVREAFVKLLLDTQLKAHPGYYGEMVWILMMLEQWLRAHAPNHKVES